ncbi:membrane protein [Microbacterium sp. HM58-2]|nr:membrane protein [Microbacterium sp. HM58-2]
MDTLVAAERGSAEVLGWGVRESLLTYLTAVGGEIALSDGAEQRSHGFCFPITSAGATRIETRGAVRLSAHGGLFLLELRDLILDSSDGETRLLTHDEGAGRTLILGTAALVDSSDLRSAPLRLHAEAAPLFGGSYGIGTELAPVEFFATGISI